MQLWWCPLNKGGYYPQLDPSSPTSATDTAVIFTTHLTILALWCAVQADRTTFLAKPGKTRKMISFVIRCGAARVLRNIKRNCCWMPRFQDTTITHNTIFHSFNKCWICKGSFPSFCLYLGSWGRAVCIIIFRCHPLYWLSERDAQLMAANARSRDRVKLTPFWEKLK